MSTNAVSRTNGHRIGDLAEVQVTALFTSQGWIVNPVVKDYGEDLIVQVCKQGLIFPFRIYVQIKGADNLKRFERKEFFSYNRFRRDTVSRWQDSSEPVLLILWDVSRESGAFGFADEIFDLGEIEKGTSSFITGRMEKASMIDENSIRSVGMQAVLNWARDQCRAAQHLATLAQEGNADDGYARHKLAHVALWVLLGLEMVQVKKEKSDLRFNIDTEDRLRMAEKLLKRIEEKCGARNFSPVSFRKIVDDATWETVILELIAECYNRSRCGLEESVLEVTVPIFEYIYASDDLKEFIVDNSFGDSLSPTQQFIL